MSTAHSALPDFLAELHKNTGGDIRTDAYSRVLYSTDASIYQVMPHGVFLPSSPEQVQAAVELAATYGITLLPRTSGSSLAGQAVGESLVVDFTRHLRRILEINPEERWMRVEPGLVLDQLNLYLQPYGLQFGPDPASSNRAAMGGIVSNNSTGSHSICYGMTADHVQSMRVFLDDGSLASFGPVTTEKLSQLCEHTGGREGEIYREMAKLTSNEANRAIIRNGTPRHWRRCGGYNLDRLIEAEGVSFNQNPDPRFNLARLVCGAEGTLAVMQDVTLDLVPIPKAKGLAVVHFDSMLAALAAVPVILETNPSAVELLDNLGLTLCKGVPEYARLLETFIEGNPDCILITEFYGENRQELASKVEALRMYLQRHATGSALSVLPVLDPSHQKDVWTVRKVGLGLLMSIKGDHKPIPFIEDAAVPTEHLASYVQQIDTFCSRLNTRVAYYAHASAGCVHIRPLVNTKAAQEIAKISEITAFAVELLHGYGGALSSEHGDGRARSWINEHFFGKDLYRLYQDSKRIFDPKNILNPGNIVDGFPVDQHLRYGADYGVIPLPLHIDFSKEQGFDRAIEMCNGAGICRKENGTMCPSYMVTREEEHTTRGRANALRAALSGILPREELTSHRMHDVMDLCVECKACKAECPSSVDMAKIKFEFLAQYHAVHGVTLRDHMFGNISRISRLSSGVLARPVNKLMGSNFLRAQLDRSLGISRHRTLPAFAREPFTTWFKRRKTRLSSPRKVVLFHDTFTTYNEPYIAIAATEVLEAAGFEVLLSEHRCCGRPMISKGLVKKARAAARHTVDCLLPYAEKGIPIVGLEPSCLLSMRDEYLYLWPEDERVVTVARHAVLFEEFFSRMADEGSLTLPFADTSRRILLHGHCHQKALVGSRPGHRTLSLPENYVVNEVDSGCCGMAGSFGYETEHYDISLRMAERRLLPAVRKARPNTTVVAAGASCRHQIKHGTGCDAQHPAEVLRAALQS